MEIHQVRYFLAVCEEGSFTGAAKRCRVTQPSLSNAMKCLEQELGGPLFRRLRRGAVLSALGEVVRPHLERLIECLQRARIEAASHAGTIGATAHIRPADSVAEALPQN